MHHLREIGFPSAEQRTFYAVQESRVAALDAQLSRGQAAEDGVTVGVVVFGEPCQVVACFHRLFGIQHADSARGRLSSVTNDTVFADYVQTSGSSHTESVPGCLADQIQASTRPDDQSGCLAVLGGACTPCDGQAASS